MRSPASASSAREVCATAWNALDAGGEHRGDRLARRGELGEGVRVEIDERLTTLVDERGEFAAALGEMAASHLDERGEMVGPGGDLLGDGVAGVGHPPGEIFALRLKAREQRVASFAQPRLEGPLVRGEPVRERGGASVDLAREGRSRVVETRDDLVAASGEMGDERLAGARERHADLFALGPEGCRHARARVRDALRDEVARLRQIARKMVLRARNRHAHAVGVREDGFALGGQFVDELAHPPLVVGIGALEVRHLGAHHGLEFAGARERALDPVAHGRHLAADRLRQGDDLLGDIGVGVGEAQRHLRHRARGETHFEDAPRQRAGDEEEHHGARAPRAPAARSAAG